MKKLILLISLIVGGSLCAAQAQDLKDVIKSGQIRIATDMSLPPYGMINANKQIDGLDVELGRLLAKDLGVTYTHVLVSGANRIPYLQTNQVDLVISNFSRTAERARSVAFSIPYATQRTVFVAPANVNLRSFDDLADVRVGVARGTTHELRVRERGIKGIRWVRFDDDAASQAALVAGQVDAIGTNDSVAAELMRRYPERKYEIKIENSRSDISIGVNKNNPELLRWVNAWISMKKNDGSLQKLYKKWVGADLPNLPAL